MDVVFVMFPESRDFAFVVIQDLCCGYRKWDVSECLAVQRFRDDCCIGARVSLQCQSLESSSVVDLESSERLCIQSSCSVVDPFVLEFLLLSLLADLLELVRCVGGFAELSMRRAVFIPPLVFGAAASHTGFSCR